jgi:hypothetical protein
VHVIPSVSLVTVLAFDLVHVAFGGFHIDLHEIHQVSAVERISGYYIQVPYLHGRHLFYFRPYFLKHESFIDDVVKKGTDKVSKFADSAVETGTTRWFCKADND